MTLPRWYTQIERMIESTALQTKMARAIVRKAGLRPGTTETSPVLLEARTLVDAYVMPQTGGMAWQWLVDLTACTRIRFVNTSAGLFVFYSLLGASSTALDPGDYQKFPTLYPDDPYFYPEQFLNTAADTSQIGGHPHPWAQIPLALRVPMRLSISDGVWPRIRPESDFVIGPGAEGFQVGIQVM